MKSLQTPYFGGETETAAEHYWEAPVTESWQAPTAYMIQDYSTEQSYSAFSNNDDESSCWSNDESVVDLSEIVSMPLNSAGELLYLQFRTAKRKFRRFQGKGRGKGMGSGKGSGKRKGKRQHYWNAETQTFNDQSIVEYVEPEWIWDESQQCYFKGKGKSKGMGSGKGQKRENPVGPDGKVMLCSLCGSKWHFRAHCDGHNLPNSSSSASSSKGTSKGGYFGQPAAQTQSLPGYVPSYHAVEPVPVVPEGSSLIEYSNGSFEIVTPPANTDNAMFPGLLNFVWFLPSAFHARVRLPGLHREGMLVDCGAIDNLAGSAWVQRVEQIGNVHGQGTVRKSIPVLSVEGVGSGESRIDSEATLPIKISGNPISTFKTNVVGDSELPGLLGLKSLCRMQSVIDVYNRKLYLIGPGGYKIVLSPGSQTLNLEPAASGHLMLPCTEYGNSSSSSGGAKDQF